MGGHAGRNGVSVRQPCGSIIVSVSAQSSYHSMASLFRILLEFSRRLLPAKDHIKRFLRRWTSFSAYFVHKMGEWRFLCPSNPGTVRDPKSPEPSFPSDRVGPYSVSSGSVCTGGTGGYAVTASTVPASANQPLGRECAEPQSDTAPLTATLATFLSTHLS